MEILGFILTVIIVTLMLSTALTFAAGLIIAVIVVSILIGIYSFVRTRLRRWLFWRGVEVREREQTRETTSIIIEGDYKDVTKKD